MRESRRGTRPRNLKDMLAEAKNTSELMVDLAYAAIFYNSEDFSEEVFRLEDRLNDLVFDMRSLAILAARSPADSEQMAGILQVVQDIEKIGNAANDIAKIVVKRLGIPPELLQDIPEAEEIPSRVRIHADSATRRHEPRRSRPLHRDRDAPHLHPLRGRLELRPGTRGRTARGRRAVHAGTAGRCG